MNAGFIVAGALGNALRDRDRDVQKTAAASLGHLGPNAWADVPSLLGALPNAPIHDDVVNSLVKIGKGAAKDLAAKLAETRDTRSRLELIDILGQIGPEAKEAIPVLAPIAAADKFPSVRLAAKEALAKIQRSP